MANKIGIVLALDGEKEFTAAVQTAKKEVNLFQSDLKALSEKFDGQANSMAALTEKQKVLTQQQEAYQRKLDAAKAGQEKANKNYQDMGKRLTELKSDLEKAREELQKMDEGTEEYKKQAKAVEELEKAVEKQTIAHTRESGSIAEWNQRVRESQRELDKSNNEIEKNARYLDEARSSADHCATSIDKMGREVKEAGDDIDEAGKKSSTFGDVLKANLTSDAVIGGVKAIAGAVKEGAEALVDATADAAAYADEILTASTVTGMSTEDLQAYGYAAELVDTSLETLTKSMAKNIKSMDNARKGSENYAEAYEKLGVQVTDADGNLRDSEKVYWECIDALGAMTDETERDAISMQLFGKSAQDLNPLIEKGSAGIAALKDEAKAMGAVLDEDTLVALSGTDDALQRLNQQTDIFKRTVGARIAPVIEGAAEAATKMLDGLSDAIDPPKSDLEKFIDDIKAANDEARETLENAQNTMSGAEADVENLEVYKDTLLELNSETEKTEFQKFQVKQIVSDLASSIPELAAAYDEETGSIKLTNTEIKNLIENQEALLLQQASMEAQQEAYKALFDAEMNAAKATSAAKEAQEEYNASWQSLQDAMSLGDTEAPKKAKELEDNLKDANTELEEANKTAADAEAAYNSFGETLETANQRMSDITGVAVDVVQSNQDIQASTEETARVYDEYGNDITDMSEEQAAAVTEASAKIVDAYQDMRDGVASSIKDSMSLFDEFSGGTETTAEQINQNLESQIAGIEKWSQNMETLAGQIGQGMSQELYDELASMGPEQSATAVQALVDALSAEDGQFEEVSENWSKLLSLQEDADAISEATTAGKDYAAAVAAGMNEGEGDITAAGESMVQAAVQPISEGTEEVKQNAELLGDTYAEAIKSKEKTSGEAGTALGDAAVQGVREQIDKMKVAGDEAAGKYTEALRAHQQEAAQAAGALASAAQNAVMSYRNAFETAGYYISAAVASGISYGASDAINAARNMAARTLAAAKAELDIHSPSKKFRQQVGQNISESTAFGISDKASLAGNEAAKMSAQVYSKATAWLSKYKKSHEVSLDDEQYYWDQVLQHVKKGTAAYNNAIKKLATATFSGTDLSGSAATSAMKKIEANFGVSRTKTTGSGKNQKTVKKDAEAYYSEIYSAANKYLSNMQTLNDWSLQAELQYWTSVQAQLKKGTQAWYDAQKQINSAKDGIAEAQREAAEAAAEAAEAEKEAAQERIRTLQSVHSKMLSQYKTYNQVSAKAEMEYWDIARQQFQEGTDARIEADQAYFDAREEYYDQLAELDEDYAEKKQDIDDDLAKSIKDLQDAYDDAVKSREQEIRSSMGLFDAWDAEGWDSGKLMANLKTQVEGLQFWEQQLDELAGKGVTQELMDELAAMGPDAAANLWSLNQMTAEQLEEYQKLWADKNNLAHKQALEDNKNLLKETQDSIADARKTAQEELAKIDKDYRDAVAKLNTGLSDGLKSLVTQAKDVGEEIVSSLVDAVRKGMTDVTALVTQAKQQAASQQAAPQATPQPAPQPAPTPAPASTSAPTSAPTKDEIMAVIKQGKKRSKTITSKEKESHSTLWQRIVKNYGYAIDEPQMLQLAALLGVSVSKSLTGEEKKKIRAALVKNGYASGARNVWQDELAWMLENAKTEYVVRTADKAILQPMRAGDKVINPKGAENLYDFAADPTKFISTRARDAIAAAQEAMQKRQDEMRSQIPELSYGGITRLNRLMESGMQAAPVVNVDNRDLVSMMQQMVSGMQAIMGQMQELQERQIVMDSGALVGALQQPMSRANAAVQRRRNRGTLR